jgi:hypothetical protein
MSDKATIQVGYEEYVMEARDALTIISLLSKAEKYKRVWAKEEDGGTTHYVYPQEPDESSKRSLILLPDNLYRIAKLAGKPDTNRS